jgi:hypothetical protein
MPREVGADCYGRCAGVVTGHVESLRACEWGYFVGAYLVGVGGVADDPRGRKLMSWESTGDFKTLDDILAYGNARAEAERENVAQELMVYEGSLLRRADAGKREKDFAEEEWRMTQAETVHDCVELIWGMKGKN